jgi:hypothetical protein
VKVISYIHTNIHIYTHTFVNDIYVCVCVNYSYTLYIYVNVNYIYMHTCEYAGLEKRFAFIGQLRVRNQAKKAVMEVKK